MNELEEFGREVERFLSAHAEPRLIGTRQESGSAAPSMREAREWQALRFDAGFGWITGPIAYGGRALARDFQLLYDELESRFNVPPNLLASGLAIVGAAILEHGTEESRQRYLSPMFRGDIVTCQLFSEPEAGSDLASLRTRALRAGESWVLTGQKVWTTSAPDSDLGAILCRTDPQAPKHRGLTMFLIDMDSPGLELRPLRDMTGHVHFSEIFLDDVKVTDSQRLGEIGEGWTVLRTALMNERMFVGSRNTRGSGVLPGFVTPADLADALRDAGRDGDRRTAEKLGSVVADFESARLFTETGQARYRAGEIPGPELSLAKLTYSTNRRRLIDLAVDALGVDAVCDSGDAGRYARWSEAILAAPAMRIAGGTDEIQKNIIGERVLGLPKDTDPTTLSGGVSVTALQGAMKTSLGEAADALRESVRAFVVARSSDAEVRRLIDSDIGWDPGVWEQMSLQLELPALGIPEQLGGSGFGFDTQAVVLEETGRALMNTPFLSTMLGGHALARFAGPELQTRWLAEIATGRLLSTLAIPVDASAVLGVSARASAEGVATLDGTAPYVIDGLTADLMIVAARGADGPSLYAVEGGAIGLARRSVTTLDLTRRVASLTFSDTSATLLTGSHLAADAITELRMIGAAAIAAEQAGSARAALALSVGYARDRRQFGRPIGSFQSVKHACVEMLRLAELSQAAAYAAARAITNRSADAPRLTAVAKATCSRALSYIAAETIQVHGGIGFTWEHPAHLFYRRARATEPLFGGPTEHALRLGLDLLSPGRSDAAMPFGEPSKEPT